MPFKSAERRRMGENMWSNFTDISDYRLDELVKELQLSFPNCGQVMLMGHLRSRGVIVPRRRLRANNISQGRHMRNI